MEDGSTRHRTTNRTGLREPEATAARAERSATAGESGRPTRGLRWPGGDGDFSQRHIYRDGDHDHLQVTLTIRSKAGGGGGDRRDVWRRTAAADRDGLRTDTAGSGARESREACSLYISKFTKYYCQTVL